MKHINLIQMLQGCSKRNGMTVSASMHDDGQNCNVKQRAELMSEDEKWSENGALSSTCLRSASDALSFRSRYLRYAAMIFCVLAMSVGQVWGATTAPTGGPHTPGTTSTVTANGRNYEVFFSNNASKTSLLVGSNTSATTEATSTTGWCNIGSSCEGNNNNISTAFTLEEFVSNVKGNNANKAIRVQSTGESEKNIVMVVSGYDSIAVFGKSNDISVYAEIWNGSSYGASSALSLVGSKNLSSHYKRRFALDKTKQYRLTLAYGTSGSSNKDLVAFSLCVPAGGSSYSITYHCNDATSGCPATNPATKQTALPSPLPTVTKTNYTFGGWYTDAAFSSAASAGATLSANADLYVKWTQTITLDREGASTGSTSVTATYNSATLPSITNPTKDGFVFEGWYDGDNGTENLVINTSGALQANVSGYTGADGIWTSATARTLYAKWTEAPCFSATINKNSSNYSVSANSSKDITSDATVTSGGAVSCVNYNASSKNFNFSDNGVSPATSDGYVQFTLPSGSMLTTGSVIRVQGYADNAAGGLLLIDDDGTTVASQTNNGALDFSYTVTAGSAINGLDHIRLKRARTSGTNAVKTVTVTGCGDAPSCTAPSSVSVDATNTNGWRYSIGETIDLTCTATGGTGTKTYQWQKYIGSSWEDIDGATNARFQKASCTSSDGGSYRCVVSTGAGCELASSGYQVYVFTLNGNYYGSVWTENAITWTGANTGTVTLNLTESSTYMYKVTNNDSKWYGGTSGNFLVLPAARDHYTDQTADIRLFTGPAGNYTFTIDITHFNDFPGTPYVNISVAYPTVSHPAEGYSYFKKWNDWDGYYIHWWYNDGSDHALSTWGSDPQITTETTICGTDYIYFPVLDTYNQLIVKEAAGDATDKTGNLSSTGSSGKYFDFTNDGAWNTFTTYTITYAANGGGSSMSAIAGICPDADQAITSNAFTAPTGCASFAHWTANVAVKVGGETVAAGNPIANGATIQDINNDITLTAVWKLATPTITDNGDNTFSISGSMAGSSYYYTTNNSTPTTSSSLYSSAVDFAAGAADITANAIAHKDGYVDSDVASQACTYHTPDPCSEPTEVANEIARFFLPCGTSTDYNVTEQASSTGDNTYTTTGFNGTRDINATTGFIYGKLTGDANYIQMTLNAGNFRAGDVVNAYFNSDNENNNLKLKNQSTGNALGAASASGYDSEYVRTYTLTAADIEGDGSIKFFRKGSAIRVNRIIVTRPPCTNVSITTQPTTPVAATVDEACSITGLVAAGTSPTYQWYTCNSDGSGATAITSAGAMSFTNWTTATLGLTPTAAGATYYKCEVSGSCGDPVTSSVVTVNASAAPAGTTYYLVTSTAQLNTTDTYIIANSTGTAIMSTTTADTNKNPDDITSGFSVDGSTLTVTSASPNLFKLTSGTYGWLFRGGNGSGNYISSDGTPDADLWYNTSSTPTNNTGEWNVSLAGGIATMKLGKASTTYHIYYDATNTKFIQSTTASNIKIYTSNSTPSCTTPAAPTSPTNGATTSNSQAVSWTDASNDAWEVYVNTSSSTPDAGQSPTAEPTSASYTFTGLTASTTYYWWVRSVCDASHKSAWVAGSSFTTSAAATLYTVTFNSNGGSAVSPITQASEGASITMPAAPTYAGHTFQGWVIGGTTKAAGASYTPAANITAYATWKANCAGGGSGSTEVYNGENVAKGNTTASGWTINNSSNMTLTSGSSDGYSYWYQASSSTNYVQFDGSASLVAGDQIKIQWTHTVANKDLTLTINGSGASLTSGGHVTTANTKMEAVYDVTSATTVTSIKLKSSGSSGCIIYQVTIVKASGGGCCYVTYNGNGAESGCISDKTAYTAGEGDVTILGNTGVSAYVKLGYRFNGWNTAANGSGMAYAAGDVVENISNDLTLHAQWVLDACSAPAAPTISGTASRTVGQTITLTATCASGADGSTTYTWYKGVDWDSKSQVQAAMTAGAGGRTFTKASCIAGDAGKYWCEASNGTGCEAHNETGFTVTVSAAVAEHIYYYKDANHYSDGTYSDPEGNTAVKKDNQSLSSPWMICNGCKAGVDSVVAHGATYDGKNNYMNAYIKLPTGGNATTKNIKFALAAGYTGTLSIKMGGYENNPTVTLQPLVAGVLGDAISYSGTVSGVATTEDNFGEIIWDLSTAGGTYVLTVTSKTGYISQIDMTTATTAKFNVTYNGNGETGGSVPTDATNYAANASVTVQAQGSMAKTNYTFGGWNTANNGTGTNYVAGSGTFNITGATTLYAHWTQSIYLAPGAQGSGTNGATVSWNGTAVRGFTAHTAAGYSLTGYYTETSGGTKVLNSDGSFAATNIDGFITDGKWSRTGAEATLYAQWSGSAIVTNTLNVGGSKTWGSSITTTAPLQITSLSALAGQGGIKVGEATDDQAAAGTPGSGVGKGSLSPKVEANSGESKNAGEYMELGFTVASGYQLRVTGLSAIVRSVSNDGKYDAVLSDGEHSIEVTGVTVAESLSSGANLFTSSYNTTFEGDVTLKIWGYSKSSGKAMTTYRYATPIAIYGAVEESCTPPTFSGLDYSATEYTQGNPASAISVTGAENVTSYAWKQNTTNDRSGDTDAVGDGASTPSFTPSTESTGTLYYWCELKNGCTTVKTSTVAVTVSASASNPTVTWSNVKLNGAATTVNYGGGKYELRATVNETGWGGTLESSMVTAPAGIYIHNIETGEEADKKYIEFQFDVTTAFDREANETIGFHLSLPAISGWNALTSDKQVSYTACDEGEGAAGQVAIPLTATAQTSASNPQNYWEVAEAGWLAFNYGSAVSVLPAATAYRTSEVDFGYYVATTNKKKWMFQPYIAGVNKVRVAFRAAGNLISGQASVSKFYYDTEYFSSPGSHENLIGDVSANQATYTSGENGYIEFTVPEMAANSYGAFELANSSIEIYGIVLYSENTGSGGTIETDPTWSGGLNKDGSSVVNRNQGDANFTYTISTTTNTLGGITYSSSNSSVAEVNATTGEVRITATGESTQTAVITATLARSGCYQPATRTYTVRVTGSACTDPIGTIEAEDLGCSGTRMTFSGYAAGATIQWYQNDSPIDDDGGDANVYTTTEAGSYYAVAHLNCDRQSNSILVTAAEVDADRVVEKWYIKNGRLTPDIKLWTLDEGSHLVSVAWNKTNATGLNIEGDIYESNGAVYLTGRAPNSNDTGADIEYTLTLTINNGCSGSTILNDASKQITIVHQKNTDKHVLAFVVTGKQNGGFTESIPASQTTSVDLYNEIAKNFDVLATNIYATDDEQKIKEYYSQFDIICITDYPNTKTKGAHSVSYSDAIGVMVDIRPVLTMEAWVSGLANWNKKGISGDPKSPTTRQYSMLLQCKDHEVFSGTTLTEVGEGDEKMYRIHMVDETLHPYDTLDANYGSGTHESKKGYRYGSYPALQGFTFSQAMEDADLLPIGLIDDGAGKDLQVGLERQHDMSARMMVLGINSTAMERLTDDGERIVINALKYLMKKNAEEIADCSTSFVGGAEGDGENWMNPDNWTGNTVPDKTQKVRILAPCTVPAGERVHVAGVLIAPNDGGTYGGSTPTTGSLTIAAGGALVVDGKVEAVTAPAYNRPRATSVEDLTIQTSSSAQGALIFDNSEGETQATVELYSLGRKEDGHYQFQYYAVPMDYVSVSESFAGSDIYTYVWHEATGWERRGYYTGLEAFEGVGITTKSADPKTYTMTGTLTSTATKEITLTKDADGYNLIGNSWTAPIQISQLEEDNSSLSKKTVYIYIAGNDTVGGGTEGTSPGQWTAIPFSAAGFSEWSGLKVIPAMQAFELVPTSEETLTLDYDKVVRGDNKSLTEPLHAPRRVADHAGIELMRIRVADSQTRTDLHLFEGERFSDEFDNGWEAAYMDGDDGTTKLYADVALGRMAVVATDELEGTLLGFAPGKEMDYTFSFGGDGMGYYLNDLKLKTSTLISEEATYSFTYEEGDTNRFYISRTPIDAPQTPTGVENTHSGTVKAHKFIYNDKLYIMLNGRVYSAEGQIVK